MTMPVPHIAEVERIDVLTHDVRNIRFRMVEPSRLHFLAGQYLSIEVTEMKDGRPRRNRRAYSIASPPEEQGHFDLCANLVRGGPGSEYLHHLQPNDRMTFLPPMGDFTVKDESDCPLLFIATGTGIAPIRSMLLHRLALSKAGGAAPPMTLIWGLRREEDLYYLETFSMLAQHDPSFLFIPTLSQPSAGWRGKRGRVTAWLPEFLADFLKDTPSPLSVYLCGSGAMIKETRAILAEKGLPKTAIHYERFFT